MSLFVTMRASPPPRPHLTYATRLMISWKPSRQPPPRHRVIGLLASLITLSATAPDLAATTYTDAAVLTELAAGTNGSSGNPLVYIIGNTSAFDTDMGNFEYPTVSG
jgi:hypothetical protein